MWVGGCEGQSESMCVCVYLCLAWYIHTKCKHIQPEQAFVCVEELPPKSQPGNGCGSDCAVERDSRTTPEIVRDVAEAEHAYLCVCVCVNE